LNLIRVANPSLDQSGVHTIGGLKMLSLEGDYFLGLEGLSWISCLKIIVFFIAYFLLNSGKLTGFPLI
jgi:hypothetical protein